MNDRVSFCYRIGLNISLSIVQSRRVFLSTFAMEEEKNAVPWKHFRDYYFISEEDYYNIGSSTCFRVQCKLCLPALKTIGTNRSSSSNLRKHMKSIHPMELMEMEKRLSSEGINVYRRKKSDIDIKGDLEMTGNWKRAKTDELSGGEKELLSQLVEEYTTALECEPKEGDEDEQRKLMWKSLTSTFNDISSGPERTHEQLKSIWEKLNNECKGSEKQFRPRIISTSMKIEKGGNESYAEGLSWENVEASDASEMESDSIGHPIIVTDENGSYASMQVSYQDDSTPRQNVYKEGRNSNSNDSKKHSEVELRLREQLLSDQKVQLQGLKQQMELKREILKEELEHQRRKNKMEFVHRKLLNSMERMMKQEAFRAEERRREEKHALELSILRMSSRLSPHMRWKIPGTNRNFVSTAASLSPSSSRKSTQEDPAKETDSMSSSLDKVAKPLSQEKKIILLQNGPSGETFEIVQEGNGNVVKLTD